MRALFDLQVSGENSKFKPYLRNLVLSPSVADASCVASQVLRLLRVEMLMCVCDPVHV